MKKTSYFLITVLLFLMIIIPVNAEILTGTLSGGAYNTSTYSLSSPYSDFIDFTHIAVKDIQYTGGIVVLIRFDNYIQFKPTFEGNASPNGNSVPFVGMWGNYTICTGFIGYMRNYDSAWPIPNEIMGYQYITFDTWDYANYTGDIIITLIYSDLGIIGVAGGNFISPPSGKIAFGVGTPYSMTGDYQLNKDFTFENSYAATKPAGLGIVGVVTKTIGENLYGSRAYIVNGTAPYNVFTSQSTVTTDNFLFNVPATTIFISVQDSLLNWYNSTKLFSTGEAPPTPTPTPSGTPTPTPTPTPAPFDTWTMDIYPTAINLGDSAQLYISCTNSSRLADSETVLYYENNNLGAYSDYILIGVYHWNSSTSNWDFRPNNSVPYDYSPHDPALLMVTPESNGEYTYMAAIFGFNSIPFGTATENLLIGAQGGQSSTLTMLLWAADILTIDHLSNYQLQITDYTGFTRFFDVEYDLELSLQRGGIYTLGAVKEGYQSGAITFIVPVNQDIQSGDFGAMKSVKLYPLGQLPSAGNCTVTVHVDDKETYYPLANVQVTMSGFTTPKFTGAQGESVFFVIPQNTQFTVRASKDGYCAVSDTKNTSTNTNMYVPLFMKFGMCAGVSPTHTPIPNATPVIPTITPIGGYGQLNGTVGICNTTTHLNASWIVKARDAVACAGIDDLLSQNLLLALIIILGIAIIAASKAKAAGFLFGGVIGAIISMALGLIPFWVIVLMVIAATAILALKIFFTPSGG